MKKCVEIIAFFFAAAGILGCSVNHNEETARISTHIPSKGRSAITIGVLNTMNMETTLIVDAQLDSLGNYSLTFPCSNPTFASLKIGQEESTIYLEPGYNLSISYRGPTIKTAYYSGKGADANNYLSAIDIRRRRVEEGEGKNINDLTTPSEFFNRIDTLDKELAEFHRNFIDSIHLPVTTNFLLRERSKMRALVFKQAYQWNYGTKNNFKIPEDLDVTDEIPYDSILLNSGMFEYATILHFNLNLKWRTSLGEVKTPEEALQKERAIAVLIHNEISAGNYSPYVKEFLLAKNLDFWMTSLGIGSPIDTLYAEFVATHPSFPNLSSLKNRYTKFEAITPGHEAPVISGITIDGDTLSSNNFKNKVIYVDVWASWCGPCLVQIPFSEKLQETFQKNDSVVFLNVSIDKDPKDWRRALSKNPTWKGEHILDIKSVFKTYSLIGIPRYMLIDKKGRIVNPDAPRPSSPELVNEIRRLL